MREFHNRLQRAEELQSHTDWWPRNGHWAPGSALCTLAHLAIKIIKPMNWWANVRGSVDSKGYGIATPKGSRWKDKISKAILLLQEKSSIQVRIMREVLSVSVFSTCQPSPRHIPRWFITSGGNEEPKLVLNPTQTGLKPHLSTLSTSEESLWFCFVASALPSSVRKVLIFNKADWSAMTINKLKIYKFTNTAKKTLNY